MKKRRATPLSVAEIKKHVEARGKRIKQALLQNRRQLDLIEAAIEKGKKILSEQEKFARSLPRKKPIGRPAEWKGKLGLELLDAVDAAQEKGAATIAEAIRVLRTSSPWREYPQRQLEARYADAKKFWRQWREWDQALAGH